MLCIWSFVERVYGAIGIHVQGAETPEAGGIPIRNVLVERRGAVEHAVHHRDLPDLPAAVRRGVQRLVERRGEGEHPAHKRAAVCLPVVQRMVEIATAMKHRAHICDVVGVPFVEVLVERRAFV